MAFRSQRLRLSDIRSVYELVGRVLEAGRDSDTWRAVAMIGLCERIGGNVGLTTDMAGAFPGALPRPIAPLDVGWNDLPTRERYFDYLTSGEIRDDPGATALLAVHQRVRFATWTRKEHIDDAIWYASPSVTVARRSGDVDDFVCTSVALRPGLLSGFVVYRPCGATPFGARECRVARLLHVRLLRLMDFNPASAATPAGGPRLSPRLKQTLDRLLAGEAVKQIAQAMELSPHTVGDYVKAIYQKYDVCSRGELLSRHHAQKTPAGLKLPPALSDALHRGA